MCSGATPKKSYFKRAHRAFLIPVLARGSCQRGRKDSTGHSGLVIAISSKNAGKRLSYSFTRNRHDDVAFSLLITVAFFYRNIHLSKSSTYILEYFDRCRRQCVTLIVEAKILWSLSLADLTHGSSLGNRAALQWHGGVGRAPVAPLDPPTRSGNRSPSGK